MSSVSPDRPESTNPKTPAASPEPQPTRRVPVLVLSGFLGSGKTTIVQRLLADARRRGLRIALVSNELGALGIDRALLGAGGQAYVELEGGCVCCELSDDLVDTLDALEREVRPDRFVIETSGVALPYDTQLNFWRDPVRRFIGDDIAVVVVNAEQLFEGRDLEGTFEDQVQSADLLVLNKIDLVPETHWAEIEQRLREFEPEAPCVRAIQGDVDPDLLFPPELSSGSTTRDRSGPAPSAPPHHHEAFATEEWRPEPGIPIERLRAELAVRCAEQDLLRAKGFVRTDTGIVLVQVVGRRIEIGPPPEPPPEAIVGRIVTIRRVGPPRPAKANGHRDPRTSEPQT